MLNYQDVINLPKPHASLENSQPLENFYRHNITFNQNMESSFVESCGKW